MEDNKELVKVNNLSAEVAVLREKIEKTEVVDQTSYDEMNQILHDLRNYKKAIIKELDPIRLKANEAYKASLALIKKHTDPIDKMEAMIKPKIGAYIQKKQKEEEEARQKIIEAEEEKRLRDAQLLKEQGQEEEADKIMDKRITVSKEEAPKMEKGGTYVTTRYSAKVVDIEALAKFCVENKGARLYLLPNMPELNKLARIKEEKFLIPGCELVKDVSVGVRSK